MSDLQQVALRMVVKQGVRPRLLGDTERALALALAWGALKAPGRWTERELNITLQALLGETLAFLDTDHVELRRWLVDGGWLQRDGYGREYLWMNASQLIEPLQATARWADTFDVSTWVTAERSAHQSQRETRRLAWQAQPPARP